MACFDVNSALSQLGGDRPFFQKLFLKFCNNYADAGTQVRTLLSQGARAEARQLTHKVAGIAGNLQAVEVHKAALSLDKVLSGNQQVTEALLVDFEFALEQVAIAIGRMEVTNEGLHESVQDSTSIGKHEILPILRDLKGLLEEADTQAGPQLEYLKSLLIARGFEAELHQMQARVSCYDFDGALDTLLLIVERLDVSLADK